MIIVVMSLDEWWLDSYLKIQFHRRFNTGNRIIILSKFMLPILIDVEWMYVEYLNYYQIDNSGL